MRGVYPHQRRVYTVHGSPKHPAQVLRNLDYRTPLIGMMPLFPSLSREKLLLTTRFQSCRHVVGGTHMGSPWCQPQRKTTFCESTSVNQDCMAVFNKNKVLIRHLTSFLSSKATSCERVQPSAIRKLNCYLLRFKKLPITSNRFRLATEKNH